MALVAPPWKIAFDAARGAWELYNLDLDPHEERNRYDDEPARAAELRSRLLDGGGGRAAMTRGGPLSDEDRRLKG